MFLKNQSFTHKDHWHTGHRQQIIRVAWETDFLTQCKCWTGRTGQVSLHPTQLVWYLQHADVFLPVNSSSETGKPLLPTQGSVASPDRYLPAGLHARLQVIYTTLWLPNELPRTKLKELRTGGWILLFLHYKWGNRGKGWLRELLIVSNLSQYLLIPSCKVHLLGCILHKKKWNFKGRFSISESTETSQRVKTRIPGFICKRIRAFLNRPLVWVIHI